MNSAALLLSLLPWLTEKGWPEPRAALDLRVSASRHDLEFGEALQITVISTWQKTLVPAPLDASFLLPLEAELIDEEHRETAEHLQRRRRYRCRGFLLEEEVTVDPVTLRGRPLAGGREEIAHSEPLRLSLRPSVVRDQPGEPELPGNLLTIPRRTAGPGTRTTLILMTLGFLLGLAWTARRRRSLETAAEPFDAQVEQRWQQLTGQLEAESIEPREWIAALLMALRESLQQLGYRTAASQATEELLADPSLAARFDEDFPELRHNLVQAERMVFGGPPLSRDELQQLLSTSRELLRALYSPQVERP